jgi:ABC-2 type transport system ATP-binding protein
LRQVTILLTSHYMKDVAALCRRVVIISQGRLIYDGSLSGIVDRFSRHKRVTLLFDEDGIVPDLSRFGAVIESQPPKVTLEVPRTDVTRMLAEVLAAHQVEDVGVEEPPLEQVIAEAFARGEEQGSGAATEGSP